MKSIQKTILFFIIVLASLIFIPHICSATTTTVDSEEALRSAIESATADEEVIIELTQNISLENPIEITQKNITIDGNGKTITRDTEKWTTGKTNATLITVGGEGSKLNLTNLTLTNSEKYGVQSYNGGYVSLNNVTIENCTYGGVLVNAGTIEIKKLHLGKNGQYGNNGIEIAKGVSVNTGNNQPTIIMNGTLTSSEKENVIYIAINDNLANFEVKNASTTVDKILVSGNKVIVTDENNNILFESNESEKVDLVGETFVKNITITVNLNEKTQPIILKEGSVLTEEELKTNINLQDLGLANYTLEGFYSDKDYKTKFDFTQPITTDTTIYAKLTLNETNNNQTTKPKDETPKTGVESHIGIAVFVIAVSIIGVIFLRRKHV